MTVVGIQYDRLEGSLCKPIRRKTRIAENGSGVMPGLAQVDLYFPTEDQLHDIPEVASDPRFRHVIALPLHDVGGEAGRRLIHGVLREEPHIPHENASDLGVVARRDRESAVVRNSRPHPVHAVRTIGQTEELPGFRNAESGESAVEAAAYDAVVRAVRLEEEGLADGQGMELSAAPRAPEIDFCLGDLGSCGEELVPLLVGHRHVTPHNGIVHPS